MLSHLRVMKDGFLMQNINLQINNDIKNIIITGTSGALGGNLRKHFANRGFNVIGTTGKSIPREGEFQISLGDWKSYENLREHIKRLQIHAIIHSAAILHGNSRAFLMFRTNVKGTENVLKLAAECKCKNFIQISSVGVYGIKSLGKNRDEKTHPFDIEPYGISKRIAENRVRGVKVPYTILRLPLLKYSGDSLIRKPIEKGKSVFIKKRELNIVSTVTPEYVAEICEIIISRGPMNDTFNCASHHQTWRDMIVDHCGHEGIKIRNTKRVSILGAFSMGLAIGPIAAFGQHTPSDKLNHKLSLGTNV